MDPWLSEHGAFDSAWFQYPNNHHMAAYVQSVVETSKKDKYIYISHEHKDHFDINFLNTLKNRDFTVILANFFHPIVKEALTNYNCKNIVLLNNQEEFILKDASIILFTIDAELECDSAILVKSAGQSFLNLNDCKLHEELKSIVIKHGKIDVFTAQFSGAIWHPTCYTYSEEEYEKISKNKQKIKFELTARAIEVVKPTLYIPSAGPPCFLDPMLMHINFEKINIFPRATQLIEYLNYRCKHLNTVWPEVMPGDVFDVDVSKFIQLSSSRVNDNDFFSYVTSYANHYKKFFETRENNNYKINAHKVFLELRSDLEKKISNLKLVNKNITTPLYWRITEVKEEIYKIDFKEKELTIVHNIADYNNYYMIESPAWQVKKVLHKEINWPDFALTFRVKLTRVPDKYNTLIHGFLTLDAESIGRFCEMMQKCYDRNERMVIEYDGKRYSVLRYCRHQGGDLSQGWIENGCLVCPRHRWQYDLRNKGKCIYNDESIDAICLDQDISDKNETN
jgi:UDP-MurNAc hydroxylase